MRAFAAAALMLAALAGCGSKAPRELAVEHAWVRLAAVPGRPSAAYFTLVGGAQPEALRGVTSPLVSRIELHASDMAGGMMTMKPLARAGIPRGERVMFAPGGKHAMLFGVDPAAKPGTELPLRFAFESGKTIDVFAKAVAAGDAEPEHIHD